MIDVEKFTDFRLIEYQLIYLNFKLSYWLLKWSTKFLFVGCGGFSKKCFSHHFYGTMKNSVWNVKTMFFNLILIFYLSVLPYGESPIRYSKRTSLLRRTSSMSAACPSTTTTTVAYENRYDQVSISSMFYVQLLRL